LNKTEKLAYEYAKPVLVMQSGDRTKKVSISLSGMEIPFENFKFATNANFEQWTKIYIEDKETRKQVSDYFTKNR
jgi:hypothetical protein